MTLDDDEPTIPGNSYVQSNEPVSYSGRAASDSRRKEMYKKRCRMEVDLRLSGLSYRDIAEAVRLQFSSDDLPPKYCETHVYTDISRQFQKKDDLDRETIRIARRIESERLDAMFMVAYNASLSGDLKAINAALLIMARRAKLLGLDKQTPQNVITWQIEVLDLIRSGRMSLEDVKQQLGTELTREVLESGGESFIEGEFTEKENSDRRTLIKENFIAEDGRVVARPQLTLGRTDPDPVS